jgi:hypothetical protein
MEHFIQVSFKIDFTCLLRIFHSYGDVTIASKGCKSEVYTRHSGSLSREGSLLCHSCCDMGWYLFWSHLKDRPICLLWQEKGTGTNSDLDCHGHMLKNVLEIYEKKTWRVDVCCSYLIDYLNFEISVFLCAFYCISVESIKIHLHILGVISVDKEMKNKNFRNVNISEIKILTKIYIRMWHMMIR